MKNPPDVKAKELIESHCDNFTITLNQAKKQALITVREILKSIVWHHDFSNQKRNYWIEVENNIKKSK